MLPVVLRITRIASSNAQMWKDITLNNQNHILSLLHELKSQITSFENMIISKNAENIYDFRREAKQYRTLNNVCSIYCV